MVDSTDVTVMRSNGYAQSDEHYHALNDAPIRRLIGRNGSAMGEIYPADPNQMARLSSPLYGRLLPDGNVNQELVKQGWCWWYRKYAPGNAVLEELEKAAREAKKGV
jgi:hypothetical protein